MEKNNKPCVDVEMAHEILDIDEFLLLRIRGSHHLPGKNDVINNNFQKKSFFTFK